MPNGNYCSVAAPQLVKTVAERHIETFQLSIDRHMRTPNKTQYGCQQTYAWVRQHKNVNAIAQILPAIISAVKHSVRTACSVLDNTYSLSILYVCLRKVDCRPHNSLGTQSASTSLSVDRRPLSAVTATAAIGSFLYNQSAAD